MRSTAAKERTTVIVVALDETDAREAGLPQRAADSPWTYVVITPLTLQRARGVVADELIVTKTMRDSPELYPLLNAIAPCFVTTGGILPAMERAEVAIA